MQDAQTQRPAFTDALGRRWLLQITVGSCRKAKDALGLDLIHPTEELFERLCDSPLDLADLLWLLCEEQAQAAGVSDEQFGCGLGGDAIDEASAALLQALVNFSPRHRRAPLEKVIEKVQALSDRMTQKVLREIESEAFDRMLEEKLGEPFTGSPESSESTPPG
jgi:hypothetical protein